MDEPGVRAVLAEMAAGDAPRSRVSIELARRRGRARLRWRRAGLAATPVLAAGAVAAIVVTMSAGGSTLGVPAAGASGTASAAPSPAPLPAAPRQFDPLVPYVSWGWLPPGQALVSGQTSPQHMYLTAGPKPGRASWSLDLYSGGQCHLRRSILSCVNGGSELSEPLQPGPVVDGRRAYWARGYLAWKYARSGWAWLMPASHHKVPDRADAVRVAGALRLGPAAGLSLTWAAQLTRLPAGWQVGSTYFVPASGKLLVKQFDLAVPGHQASAPNLTVAPAAARSSCYFYPGRQSARRVINGDRVTVNHLFAVRGNPPIQQLCAARADQLFVFVSEAGTRPALSAVALFRDHLRLLGPDPANWAASPVG
ncbi:MAG TPA: hypothetical protein VGG35_16190 [Streptosporangiaceae bacterium]|jgi:hypothetical protein